MLWRAMRIAEVKVAQINRQRHRRAQHANRIALVNRKITKHQQTAERAAFPKTEGDHTLAGLFRGDPLDEEAQAENQASGEAHDFPGMNHDPKDMGLGEKLKAVHRGEVPPRRARLQTRWRLFPT